jgi:hypothetical protein
MIAEKVADSRRDNIDYFGINSANICGFFCEHLREPFSLSTLKFLLMSIGEDLAVIFYFFKTSNSLKLSFLLKLHLCCISEKRPYLIPEITTQNEPAADKDGIDADVDDQPGRVCICNEVWRIRHDVVGDDRKEEHHQPDHITPAADFMRFRHLYEDMPEFVFDPEIGRLAKDSDTGYFHDGCACPENGKNKSTPEMICKKLLEKNPDGKDDHGKEEHSKSKIEPDARVFWRIHFRIFISIHNGMIF